VAIAIPEFGERIEGRTYVPRPGAYALTTDSRELVGVVRSRGAYFLPGGGIEAGETAEDALRRELREELGWSARILARVGEAVQYLVADGEGCFVIRGTFFRVGLLEKVGEGEPDCQLEWFSVSDAIERLHRRSDAWAVGRIVNPNRTHPSI
jgi:8-oxo-dGTP diphosphatase